MNRPRALAALVSLVLVLGACSSDDSSESTTDTTGGAAASSGGELSLDECIDAVISLVNDVDFDDAAQVDQVGVDVEALGAQCQQHDGGEVQVALEARRDDLTEGADAYIFGGGQDGEGSGVASAAGLPCVAPTSDLGVDTSGATFPEGEPPTELVIDDLVVGDGDEVTAGATVEVDYVGYSCSTGETFDSSYERGESIEFGLDQVISGWSDGLVGMQVGGKRVLVIPSDQGYGAAGSPPNIAPDETLVFVVEMLGVTS